MVILERTSQWRWHACGVFASPAAVAELSALGMTGEVVERLTRPIPAMRVETARKTVFHLGYRAAGAAAPGAVGFDREALDGALLALAVSAGAEVLRGHAVEALTISPVANHRQVACLQAGLAQRREQHLMALDGDLQPPQDSNQRCFGW